MTRLTTLDWIVVAIYFVILLAIVMVERRPSCWGSSPACTSTSRSGSASAALALLNREFETRA